MKHISDLRQRRSRQCLSLERYLRGIIDHTNEFETHIEYLEMKQVLHEKSESGAHKRFTIQNGRIRIKIISNRDC